MPTTVASPRLHRPALGLALLLAAFCASLPAPANGADTMGGMGVGLQAGAVAGPMALVLMNEKAVESFRKRNNFSLNADSGLTVLNFARMAQGSSAGDVVAWSGGKGLFGNAITVGMDDIRFHSRLTDAFYGKPTSAVGAIDAAASNRAADALRQVLTNPPTPTASGAR